MKQSPLNNCHVEDDARFVNFFDWSLPLNYKTSILEEHKIVREEVGLFDISHMGQINICGSDSLKFLQRITTNDVSKLKVNECQYSLICNSHGGIIDDIFVYRLGINSFRLVVNASNKNEDMSHIRKYNNMKTNIFVDDVSDYVSTISVQGPDSDFVLKDFDLPSKRGCVRQMKFDDYELVISKSGYTGEKGYELYLNVPYCTTMGYNSLVMSNSRIWNQLKNNGARPIGLGARDLLRLEKGYVLHGQDLDSKISPFEASLEKLVYQDKFFIGKKAMNNKKLEKKLIGLRLDKGIPRNGNDIFFWGQHIGCVTSGNISPVLGKGIAWGYVNINQCHEGVDVEVKTRKDKTQMGKIVKIPFI